jgi:hypothetical protein
MMFWLYFVETDCGVGIRRASSLDSAYSGLAREIGENNINEVREATDEDIEYVRSMGGYIPAVCQQVGG